MLFVRSLQGVLLPPLPLIAAEVVDIEGTIGSSVHVQIALHFD
jgi:hypothetical protein